MKDRITARVSVDTREQLIEAAAFSGTTLNQFLVQAAIEKAQSIIEKERVIRLSCRDAEVFFDCQGIAMRVTQKKCFDDFIKAAANSVPLLLRKGLFLLVAGQSPKNA